MYWLLSYTCCQAGVTTTHARSAHFMNCRLAKRGPPVSTLLTQSDVDGHHDPFAAVQGTGVDVSHLTWQCMRSWKHEIRQCMRLQDVQRHGYIIDHSSRGTVFHPLDMERLGNFKAEDLPLNHRAHTGSVFLLTPPGT